VICTKCGNNNPDHGVFCGHCGAPLATPNPIPNPAPVPQAKVNKSKIILFAVIAVLTLAVVIMATVLIVNHINDSGSGYAVNGQVTNGGDTTSGGSTTSGGGTKPGAETSEGEFYPGTSVPSFTAVTGIPMYDDPYTDEDGLVTFSYEIESMDDVDPYLDALEDDGYYVNRTIRKLSDSFSVITAKKDSTNVTIGFEVTGDDTYSPIIYLIYQEGAGLAGCMTCSAHGYDRCQGHDCEICSGRGSSTCSGCGGTGRARVPSSYSDKCVVCYGMGTQICPNCDGAGKIFIGE